MLTFTETQPGRLVAFGAAHRYVIDRVTEWDDVEYTVTVAALRDGDHARVDCEFPADEAQARQIAGIHEALTDPAAWGGLDRLAAATAVARHARTVNP